MVNTKIRLIIFFAANDGEALLVQFSSVTQSCPTLCDPMNRSTPASLSITNPRSSFRLTSIESLMPTSHLILGRLLLLLPQSLPASESFPMSQLFTWGGQSTGASALASFLPKKSQGWSPSKWIGWISFFYSLNLFFVVVIAVLIFCCFSALSTFKWRFNIISFSLLLGDQFYV